MVDCPECGRNDWQERQWERTNDAYQRLRAAHRQQAAEQAKRNADHEIHLIECEQRWNGLQRKVDQQRRVINRLEAKIRKLGQQPYAPEPNNEGGE